MHDMGKFLRSKTLSAVGDCFHQRSLFALYLTVNDCYSKAYGVVAHVAATSGSLLDTQ